MLCCSFHPRKGSHHKLNMVPYKTTSDIYALRPWVAYGSVNSNGRNWEIGASSDTLFSNDSRGSAGLLAVTESPQGNSSDFEKQLEELFYEVKSMIKMGKEQDAACLLQANHVALKEQMDEGARGIEEAAILVVIALGYMAIGDIKMVRSQMNMLSGIVDDLEDDEPLLDSILTHMGSMCSAMGKSENAMLAYRRAIGILEKNYGKRCTPLINPLLGMAKVLGSMGRANKASEVYDQVINIMEVNRGAQSEDLVVPLLGIGNLLIKEGKVEDAENAFSRIVSIYQKIYGNKDRRFGMALCSLAHAKCAKGDADQAINLYKDALRILKDSKHISLDDSMMDKIRIDLVELLHITGRGQEGHEILEECLLIAEECYGKDHPNYVLHLINIAASYSNSKNYVEAERLLRIGVAILTKSVGPDDQSVTFPKLHLAVALYNLHKYDEAEKLALEVLHVREKAFGRESIPVGEAIECLVSIQARMDKTCDNDEMVELLKRLLVIQENEFGYESEDALETLKKLLFYLDKLGRKEEKLPIQKRLTLLRKKFSEMVHY
ncbi:nephrocystin-3 [Impatiens glandulifera]|uniref:nephrocystin-3 n=1 Tax=Impatiens glandulifera TaxID=253017 RepID=UPI001FB0CD33|nr:nephrocystin-3 [Impatiens glandulifera]